MEEIVYASAADLQAGSALSEEDVPLPNGKSVRVRGVRRADVLDAQRRGGDDAGKIEAYIVAAGMVQPQMTPSQVRGWQMNSIAGEINPVVARIRELSGMGEDAVAEAWKSDRA